MNTDRLKFRVFDKKNEEYVPEGDMCDVHCLLHRDGTLDCGISFDDGYAGSIDWIKDEDAVIEQCTGLTDKNGKLIFENDVVNVYIPYEDEHRKSVVQYVIDEGTAQWLAVYLEGKRSHCSIGIAYDITSEYLDGGYCEIIGNIHEDQFREVTKKKQEIEE